MNARTEERLNLGKVGEKTNRDKKRGREKRIEKRKDKPKTGRM